MGFSISSPGLQQLQRTLEGKSVGKEFARAVEEVTSAGLLDKLQHAAYAAGGSQQLQDEIGVFIAGGSIFVGVPRNSPAYREAKDLEYGTAVGAPAGWLRATVAREQHELGRQIGARLVQRLGLA